MHHIRNPFTFFCLVLAPVLLFAQKKDTIIKNDSLRIVAVYEKDLYAKNFEKNYFEIDTSLIDFQKKENFNHDHRFYARSAAAGTAKRDLVFQSGQNFDQISSIKYFRHYFYNYTNAKYYYAPSPYADAFYMMGPKHEQIFNILFTRNFGELTNLAIDYYLLYSNGTYYLSKSNDNFLSVTSNFHSKSKRYLVIADYFYNRMKVQENGGISYDANFTENLQPDREFDSVRLGFSNAENRIKESGIYFKQFYFPGFYNNKKDTIKGNERYFSFGRFSYSILLKNNEFLYYDEFPLSGFYSNVLLDSILTEDSVQNNIIENEIEWSNIRYNCSDSTEQHFLLSIGAKHQKQHLYNIDSVANYYAIIPEAKLKISFEPVTVNITGSYVTGGYNKNDFSGGAIAEYSLSKDKNHKRLFSIGATSILQEPCWFDQHYTSNNFKWEYDFEKINTNKIFIRYKDNKLIADVTYYNIANPVYYDTYARPKQMLGSEQILQLRLEKLFKFGKWSFDNDLVYQRVSGTDVIRLPELMSNHSLYYSNILIKNVLSAQFGADVTFFSSYYPHAYMPSTKEFYLQNDFKSSAYPYIDFFMNFKIKRIRIFLKLDHLNSGLIGYNYIMIPHYPMADRAFRFGLSWIFHN